MAVRGACTRARLGLRVVRNPGDIGAAVLSALESASPAPGGATAES